MSDPNREQTEAAWLRHIEMENAHRNARPIRSVEAAHNIAGAAMGSLHAAPAPSPERLIAIRSELIRLCHYNGDTPEGVVNRADVYLSFILNEIPNKGESINAEE